MARHWRNQQTQDDAWGSDIEDSSPSQSVAAQPHPAAVPKPAGAGRPWAAALAKPPQPPPSAAAAAAHASCQDQQVGPDSLHAICLGVLGEHLDELLEDEYCRQEILPLLPSEVKACLLALARLRRLLCDAALLALADEGHTVLDLHGCGTALSDGTIQQALQRMPRLRAVDLTSCHVSAATLRMLGEACPAVELLRLGSTVSDETAGRGLRDILPVLEQRQQAPAAESWDALLDAVDDAGALAAAVAGGGRLMQLQCVQWPNIPHRLAEHCRTACPKVALNPTPEQVAAARLPPACDPMVQLDAPLLAEVSNSGRWEHAQQSAASSEPVVHIAERFRQAYISRAARVRAKMERNWQQQRRREMRKSQAEQMIRQWEGEL